MDSENTPKEPKPAKEPKEPKPAKVLTPHAQSFVVDQTAKGLPADKDAFAAFVAKLSQTINPEAFARVKPELDEALASF